MPPPFSLNTPIAELYQYRLARFGQTISHNLAREVASHFGEKDYRDATVEDLLNYLPMRYEDRSNPAHIRDLVDGMEASLDLTVKVAGGYQVRNRRAYGRSRLFIFEVTATDPDRTGRPVVVWWFVSGAHAHDIIDYYTKRFTRGARFITFGRWEWDKRRATFALRLNKPADELEMLPAAPGPGNDDTDRVGENKANEANGLDTVDSGDPALAVIHTGRRVPIYRKLGEFSSKRIREIIHAVLSLLPDSAF
ncbi:MAG TPA: hypothetical protein VGJ66_03260, partial [Pyrinomonadaceae bacterium]